MVTESKPRAHPRVVPKRILFVEYPNHLARVRNLSLSGAFIEDTRPLCVGQMVHFMLWLDDVKPVETDAMIRRRDEGQGLGVEFRSMSETDRARLRETIMAALL